jgi:hypothetical protein
VARKTPLAIPFGRGEEERIMINASVGRGMLPLKHRLDGLLRALSFGASRATVHKFNNARCAVQGLWSVYKTQQENEELRGELETAIKEGVKIYSEAVWVRRA